MNKWTTDHLEDSDFPAEYQQLTGGSQSLLQSYIQDVVTEEHPCRVANAEPCENILEGTCLIVFPNSTLRITINPEYETNTIWFINCRD